MSHDPQDDALLDALAGIAREARADEPDPRWDALAADDLSAEDQAALRALVGEDDALHSAFAPIDEMRRAGFVDAMLSELDASSAEPQHAVPTPAMQAPAKIIPFRQSFLGRAITIAAPIALAAGLAWVVLAPGAARPVPGYSIEATGGLKTVRSHGPESGPVIIAPGVRIDWVISPDTAVEGPIGLTAYLTRDGGSRHWPLSPTITPAGAVRITGDLTSLGLASVPPGRWTAVFSVGRPDALLGNMPPADPPDDAGWRRLTLELDLRKSAQP
jgi:hypothetical protein